MIHDTEARAAFVSTNSITQGEQVAPLWGKLLDEYGVHIDFAWRTFAWNSEATDKAHVHVVIVGFSCGPKCPNAPRLFDVQKDGSFIETPAKNINAYLLDAPDVLIGARGRPLCEGAPLMTKGNQPSDGGHLILSQGERDELIRRDPRLSSCVRRYVGARDFINDDQVRYCLWLKDVPPDVWSKDKEIMRRVDAVRQMRLASTAAPTRALADAPYRFFSTTQPDGPCLCVPRVSSERRRYAPMGFLPDGAIAADSISIVHHAGPYHFGVLTSDVHMAWMRVVAGRLETRYRYSKDIVYNNFVWPEGTPDQREKIERTAQAILDARALFPDSSLADLYDDAVMPPELRKAHRANDAAVRAAYGFPKDMSEPEIVAALMEMWREMAGEGRGRASVRANDTERREGDAGASRTY